MSEWSCYSEDLGIGETEAEDTPGSDPVNAAEQFVEEHDPERQLALSGDEITEVTVFDFRKEKWVTVFVKSHVLAEYTGEYAEDDEEDDD
jgi:hypothetical protein